MKRFHRLSTKKENGIALVAVLSTMLIVSFLIMSMFWLFISNTKSIDNHSNAKELYYHAKTGIEVAEAALYANIGEEEKKILYSIMNDKDLVFEDSLTSAKIPQLPKDVKIDIKIEYSELPPSTPVTPENSLINNKIKITSTAFIYLNQEEEQNYQLIKYIDTSGINSTYQ